MKKIFLFVFIILVLAVAFGAWKIFGPATKVPEGKYFYINTGSTYEQVRNKLVSEDIINSAWWFDLLADYRKYKTAVKPGRYEITKDMSLFELMTMLRNGKQSPVDLVITKLRTKEGLAERVEGKFEFDSAAMVNFLNSNDSLKKYGVDTQTVMASVMPNTYTYFWNTTPDRIFKKFHDQYVKFWTEERKRKADALGFTPLQVITLASIIDEESNKLDEKDTIASVYMNRIRLNMPLQADPTVKYALRDFGLKRIYERHLLAESPYNTYRNRGLPPGPICTPQAATIDAVLNAPKTEYLYFVAKSDFSGAHVFATNYDDHLKWAREYQRALNQQDSIRKANP